MIKKFILANFLTFVLITSNAFAQATTPFSCDVRINGAVGDGVTDDTTAIQGCINSVIANYGAGTVSFPPSAGAYCTFSGLTVSGGIPLGDVRLIGAGERASAISTCGHNITALFVDKQFGSVENIAFSCYGMIDTDAFNVTHVPCVIGASGASYWTFRHLLIQGGSFPIQISCSGCRIVETVAQYGYGDGSGLRAANAYVFNSGQYWLHDSFDQVLPVFPTPTFPTTIVAWAASHAYAKGTVVTFSCGGSTWFYQASTAGTSGTVQPACKNYLRTVTDGSMTWLFDRPNPFYSMQVDTGSNEVIIDSTDMTGFFTACFAMTNTFEGVAPINVRLHSVTPGGCYNQGVLLRAGANFKMEGGDFQGCISVSCQGVFAGSWFGGNIIISGVQFDNGGAFSVYLGITSNVTLSGNLFGVGSSAAVLLTAGSDYIAGIGNTCVGASAGLTGSLGAHSYFPVSGNPGC